MGVNTIYTNGENTKFNEKFFRNCVETFFDCQIQNSYSKLHKRNNLNIELYSLYFELLQDWHFI